MIIQIGMYLNVCSRVEENDLYICSNVLYAMLFQLNIVTHYLDLSLVYGSSDEVATSLRAGFGGRLNVEVKNNREFPPPAANKSATCDTIYEFEPCYAAGENKPHIRVQFD